MLIHESHYLKFEILVHVHLSIINFIIRFRVQYRQIIYFNEFMWMTEFK